MKSEKGQGLIEYAIVIVILAIVVIIILAIIAAACLWLPALIAVLFAFWTPISTAGSALVAGVMAGNPMSIFIAVVILAVLAWVILGRRRSS